VNAEPATTTAAPPTPPATPTRGEVRLKLFARTDVGQIREHNEDNFLVADLTKRSRGLLEANRLASVGPFGHLFAVCDGMGGAAAGEVASQLAVDIIYERMVDGLDQKSEVARDEIARRLVRAVETAGFRIFQEAKADRSRRGMGTTVTAAALVDDHLFFAQVGDSRGYILRDGVLTQVTRDQPADRGGAAHGRRGGDVRAQQHHPSSPRHERHGSGRPYLRRGPPGRRDAALFGRAFGDGPVRRHPGDDAHRG